MDWAAFSALEPGGQTRVMETTKAAQARDHRVHHKLFETDDTFNANKRALLGEAVDEIFGSWWRLALSAVQATSDVSLLFCSWTKLGQVLTADGTLREVAQLRACHPRHIGGR